jgi:hypothetical protein
LCRLGFGNVGVGGGGGFRSVKWAVLIDLSQLFNNIVSIPKN